MSEVPRPITAEFSNSQVESRNGGSSNQSLVLKVHCAAEEDFLLLIHAFAAENKARRRTSPRHILRLESLVTSHESSGEVPIEILDLSSSGFLMRANLGLTKYDKVRVEIVQSAANAQVVWMSGDLVGCHFDRPLSKAQLSAALLKSDPIKSNSKSFDLRGAKLTVLPNAVGDTLGLLENAVGDGLRVESGNDCLAKTIAPADDGEREEARLPLYLRGWAILISSVLLWALLLAAITIF